MGFLDFMFENEEKGVTSHKKSGKKLSDILFETDEGNSKKKPKRKLFDFLFEEEKPSVEFTNPEDVQKMANSLNGKLQDKKRELTMMGLALRQINVKDYPGSDEIIQQYLELVETQQRLSTTEEKLKDDDIMGRITLERDYGEFEQNYNKRISRIKTLFYYNEIKRQNNRMKDTFNTQSVKQITPKVLDDYRNYIQKIIDQQSEFSDDYKEEILSELLVSEYRLAMLNLMRDVYCGEESYRNPFSKYSGTKKDRFAELLFGDISDADAQFQNIMKRKSIYTKTKVLREECFEQLSREADNFNLELNNGIIDGLSMDGMFEDEQYDSLKMFLQLKIKMNEIDSKYEQAKNIYKDKYLENKPKSKKKQDHEDHEREIKLLLK